VDSRAAWQPTEFAYLFGAENSCKKVTRGTRSAASAQIVSATFEVRFSGNLAFCFL